MLLHPPCARNEARSSAGSSDSSRTSELVMRQNLAFERFVDATDKKILRREMREACAA